MVEVLVVLAIFGIMLAVGIPKMSNWIMATRAGSASEFYLEGFRLARQQAISHNAASRIVLSPNVNNGQYDWQVDICFPTVATPCSATSGAWSATNAIATNDPEGATGYTSVRRLASSMPPTSVVSPALTPEGTFSIYYTALGWVDTTFGARTTRITLSPGPGYESSLSATAVVVTLAGMPSKCDPNLAIGDSRACPP